ncbi:sulfatase-like hydrolase/transferase [Haladaptatus salinisoli]|uniref:sulfatase-like hydrolase/transferase n=1 Tax=Haladaptatus salinisoli TaxID=2884876 RepID=UPI001D0BA81B|nr:sulfatase-like hydrolase/transferase [Haladaptatus salinisoli]
MRQRVERGVRRVVPDGVADSVEGAYAAARRGIRARRANRSFERRDAGDPTSPAADAPDHVVLVVVDALRADALDAERTPFLSSLDGTDAVAPATWTFPSVTSLLSGTYPHDHGAMRRSDDYENSVADVTGLPPQSDVPLLADHLDAAGYRTYGAFGFVVPFLALRGRFAEHRLYADADARRLLADHAEWLADRRDDRTFSYLHLADLHEPVEPPAPYAAEHDVDTSIPDIEGWNYEDVVTSTPTADRYRRNRRRLYEAAVEYADDRLAAHHRRVADLVDDAAFVVTGDHGEGFWERARFHADTFADPRPAYCVGHGGAPHEAVTRVPVRTDGFAVAGTDRPTSLVDIAPTVLRAATGEDGVGGDSSADADPDAGGVPLDEPVPDDRIRLVEGTRYGYEKKAVYADGWKLMVSRGDDASVGFSLPSETETTIPPDAATRLSDALPPWPTSGDAAAVRDDVAGDVARRLERLGYR